MNNGELNNYRKDFSVVTIIEKNESYIKYTLSGFCSANDIENIPNEIYEQCQKKNIWRILLDTSGIHQLNINITNQFCSGESIAKVLNVSVRLAVYGDGEIFTDFTETVAVNLGADVKVSNDYNNLKSWLMEN